MEMVLKFHIYLPSTNLLWSIHIIKYFVRLQNFTGIVPCIVSNALAKLDMTKLSSFIWRCEAFNCVEYVGIVCSARVSAVPVSEGTDMIFCKVRSDNISCCL